MALDVAQFATQALSIAGTLGGIYLGSRLTTWRDRSQRQAEIERQAKFLAIRVVCILDPFVRNCIAASTDEGEPDANHVHVPRTSAPTINLPNDVDWKAIDPKLAYAIISLPDAVARAEDRLSHLDDFTPDRDDYFNDRMALYAQIGLDALKITEQLRETFDVPKLGSIEDIFDAAILTKARDDARRRTASNAAFAFS